MMDDIRKFEGSSLASELLSDLKRIIRMQRWIIVALAATLVLVLVAK